jgi:voltage-gated potassium channel
MTSSVPVTRTHGNSYEIFILVLTVLSLVVMVLLVLPLSQPTLDVLTFYDNLICIVFLADFAYSLTGSHPRSEYFIHRRGWLDLLGSIPSFGVFRFAGLLRLARLSRLARIVRLLSGQHKTELIADVLHNRSQYALFITLMLVMLVLTTASVLVVQFESQSPDSNIKTGGDALWWAFVTLTTVGYGDRFPITTLGRVTGIAVMFGGIGVIGALASILASILVSPAPPVEEAAQEATATAEASDGQPATAAGGANVPADLALELVQTRLEMAELRKLIAAEAALRPDSAPGPGS